MRVLLDTCVWGGSREFLVRAGHDVVWAGGWESDPGDAEILAIAHQESRVLVTLDKDFGELAIVRRERHSGIIRLVDVAARSQGSVAARVLSAHEDELLRGAIVTVEPGRLRVRPAD